MSDKATPSSEITAGEIRRSGFIDAFTTIQSLRPQWLVIRGQTSFANRARETIKVYLDGNLLGTLENLKQLPTNSIASMRHLDGIEASNRYGLDHGAGAILISSSK